MTSSFRTIRFPHSTASPRWQWPGSTGRRFRSSCSPARLARRRRSLRESEDRRRRQQAEEALREREEFFRLISENVTDLIAVIDHGGRWVYNSPSYKNILGDPEKLRSKDSFKEIHPEDRERMR